MNQATRRFPIRLPAIAGLAIVVIVIAAAGLLLWLRAELRASLPAYSGELPLAGLAAPVVVERDALGTVTVLSSSRTDEARALGFVHAQERYFQMDLLRRSAAGELAALVGPAALDADRAQRVHEMRATAARVVEGLPATDREWLEAYADGVNAGLAALGARPFEYLLLRQSPVPWRAEDSVLAVGAMYVELQEKTGRDERAEFVARSVVPAPVADLLYPDATPWDAPLVGEPGPPAVIPPAAVYDLRRVPAATAAALDRPPPARVWQRGSNNWAVGPQRSASGIPIVANDPHLELQVPSIWFRVSLVRGGRRVTGASLPGIPAVVFGSNGRVAWGLTNAYGDWTDVVALELAADDPTRYLTPDGPREIERVTVPIDVAGREPVPFEFERTVFGPVLGRLPDGRPFAVRWIAHEPRAYGFAFAALHEAETLDDAFAAAQRAGIPAQNFVAADRAGRIGWTLAGPAPRRGRDALISESSRGSGWTGWLAPPEYPVVADPPAGFVFTANGRVVGGEMLAAIGRGNFALGARGAQIRTRLAALERATPTDMLAVQLDDEALFLAPWRAELVRLLDGETEPLHAAVRGAVRDWGGRAAVDSVGYRIVREWRSLLIRRMTDALTAEIRARHPDWRYRSFRTEHWAWPLVAEEPPHLLDPAFTSWRQFKLGALDDYLRQTLGVETPAELASKTWGEANLVRARHPLSRAVPLVGRWLDMPAVPMPGDTWMPRVQGPNFGATARFAVSPGDEAAGYFQMAGGQSGHPLSAYYGAGHADWVAGVATPFLPGPARDRLRLVPRGG